MKRSLVQIPANDNPDVASLLPDPTNEQIVIAAAMADDKVRDNLVKRIPLHEMITPLHRKIWGAFREMSETGLAYDPATVQTILGPSIDVKGFLGPLQESRPDVPPNLDYHVELLLWDRVRIGTWAGPIANLLAAVQSNRTTPEKIRELARNVVESVESYRPQKAFDPNNPLASFPGLNESAIDGIEEMRKLAEAPIDWVWEHGAARGEIAVFAARPAGGKTTFFFKLIAARANTGEAVEVLGKPVYPAPEGQMIVVIEAEHGKRSTARIALRTASLMRIDADSAFSKKRTIFLARENVHVGDKRWNELVMMIRLGLISDIYLDTLASTAPEGSTKSDDEGEQVKLYELLRQAIESAPSEETKPTVWIATHTRKGAKSNDGELPALDDVSGSTQRVGQADRVYGMCSNRDAEGKVISASIKCLKAREQDADSEGFGIKTYTIGRDGIKLTETPRAVANAACKAAIVALFTVDGKARSMNALQTDKVLTEQRYSKHVIRKAVEDLVKDKVLHSFNIGKPEDDKPTMRYELVTPDGPFNSRHHGGGDGGDYLSACAND